MTLACRIEKKGGEWVRHYLIAEGDTPIEALQGNATQLGVREYQQVLHGAGLTPAIGQVLSLEQGQTDKLCELSPKALLDLVFQVFGDREVLDRYQEARQHQEATRRELVELEAQLERLQLKIKNTELDVDNYQTWCRLNDDTHPPVQRNPPPAGIPPARRFHPQGPFANHRHAARMAQLCWLKKRPCKPVDRKQKPIFPLPKRNVAPRAMPNNAPSMRKRRSTAKPANWKACSVNATACCAWPRKRAAIRKPSSASRAKRKPGATLCASNSPAGKNQQRELEAIIAALASGQRAEPGDIRAFRTALDNAGIAHDLLVDLVEITDTNWQKAVEALLAPFAHLVILHRERDAEAAFALGEKHKFRHFIVPERSEPTLHAPGSIAEVVHFRRPVPGWIDKLLDRTQRVEDAHAGARLPRAQDWVTKSGYLRERRGGRHAAPEFARFGAARLAAVQAQLAELAPRIASHEARIGEYEQTIATCRAHLAGESATQTLAARAAEFAAAETQRAELEERRQQVQGRPEPDPQPAR